MIRRLAVVLVASGLGLFGCRGHTVPTRVFIARGNAACAAAARRIAALAAPRTPRTAAPETFAGYVDDYVAELRLELSNLRAIGYPPGDRARVEAAYTDLETALDAAEHNPLGFAPGALEPADQALSRLGLSTCRQ